MLFRSVEVAFQAGCVNITVKVVADNACDPAKPMTLAGEVLFECGAMVGEGRVSGAKWCNDGDTSHPLYRIKAEIPMLSMGALKLKDTAMELLFVYPANFTGPGKIEDATPDWNFTARATLDLFGAEEGMPELPKSEALAVSITAGVERYTNGDFKVYLFGDFTFETPPDGDNPPAVSVKGNFTFEYPCKRGAFVGADASAVVHAGEIKLVADASVRMYCDPPINSPALVARASIDELKIQTFTLSGVVIKLEGFKQGVDEVTGIELGMGFIVMFRGNLTIEEGDFELGASIYFKYDSMKGTIQIQVELSITTGPVELNIALGFGTGDACDKIKGNYITGSAKVAITPDNALKASVRGAIHCDAHQEAMKALDKPSFGRHEEFVRMRDIMAAQADKANLDALASGAKKAKSNAGAAALLGAAELARAHFTTSAGVDAPLALLGQEFEDYSEAITIDHANDIEANSTLPVETIMVNSTNVTKGGQLLAESSKIKVHQDAHHPQYELEIEIDEFEIAEGVMLKGAYMRMWSLNPEYKNSSDGTGGFGGGEEDDEEQEMVQWAYEIYGAA